VVGVTFNPPADLKKWADDEGYSGTLLFDEDRSVAMAYGAASSADQEKATRISVLIGSDGKVAKTYEVEDAPGHADAVLGDVD
jgi:peroxiredoxin